MCGIAVQVTGKYVWANYVGWFVMTLGIGLLALLKVSSHFIADRIVEIDVIPLRLQESSSTGMWVGLQLIAGVGAGALYTGPQVCHPLPSDRNHQLMPILASSLRSSLRLRHP